jgi:hypothetical protein
MKGTFFITFHPATPLFVYSLSITPQVQKQAYMAQIEDIAVFQPNMTGIILIFIVLSFNIYTYTLHIGFK